MKYSTKVDDRWERPTNAQESQKAYRMAGSARQHSTNVDERLERLNKSQESQQAYRKVVGALQFHVCFLWVLLGILLGVPEGSLGFL